MFNLFLGLISYTFDRTADDDLKASSQSIDEKAVKKPQNDDEAEADLNEQLEKAEDPTKNNQNDNNQEEKKKITEVKVTY